MARVTRKLTRRRGVVRKAYARLETNLLAAAGRRVVRRRIRAAQAVARRAGKAALSAGALAAAGVVLREFRQRRSR